MKLVGTQEEIEGVTKNCYAECDGCVLRNLEECPVAEDHVEIVD